MLPKVIEFSGLEGFMSAKLSEFSSGMRQRLAFATIIQTVNGIIFVDEIMAVGDQAFQKKCLESYRGFLENGNTIVFVTQGLEGDLKDLCTNVLYLSKGEQRFYGNVVEGMIKYCSDEGL
jgi:ABC-type polysaccharide/polyol phosphate transport system ATPase subunit